MTAPADDLVNNYLHAVERALIGVPVARRAELLSDLREHVAAERALLDPESETGVRSILDRLGDPDTVAAEARLDLGPDLGPDPAAPPPAAPSPVSRGWPSAVLAWVLAVVLTVVTICVVATVLGVALFRGGDTKPGAPLPSPAPTTVVPTQRPS